MMGFLSNSLLIGLDHLLHQVHLSIYLTLFVSPFYTLLLIPVSNPQKYLVEFHLM